MSIRSSRSGIALISALSLLALLGLLLAGAVATATVAEHATRASLPEGTLLGAADYAVGELVANPSRFGLADLPLGVAHEFAVSVPGLSLARSSVVATRLPTGVYWLVGKARMDDADSAERLVNVIARTAWLGTPPAAPLVARGTTALAPDVTVLNDGVGEPDCAVSVVPPAAQTGDSSAVFDSAATWSALTAAPGVRFVRGDTTISSGAFEGILIVSGELTIDGPVDLRGLVIARGRIRSTIGLHLTGAMVSASNAPSAIALRAATIRFAPCLVQALLRRASPVRIARGWGWAELF